MKDKHTIRFDRLGSPHSRALYAAFEEEGLVRWAIDLKLEQLRANGAYITPEIKSQIKSDTKRKRAEYHRKVRQVGVPDKFEKLFLITKKAEAEQYLRQVVVSEYDLFLLIHNCSQIHFTHRSKFKEYTPEHLEVSDTDLNEMKSGKPKQFFKKTDSQLLERRLIHVHLFECGSDWHCLYFSHQDIEPSNNHWEYGCHLHYVSHLWPNKKKGWIWNKFNKRYTKIKDSLHIRFKSFDFSISDEGEESKNQQPLAADIFNSNLAFGCGSVPLPVAHMATRGVWFAQVSLRFKSIS